MPQPPAGSRPPLRLLAVFLALALLGPGPVAAPAAPDCRSAQRLWSRSDPPLDLTHVFCGARSARGASITGYHAVAGRRSPGEAVVRERYAGPNADGVSRAVVCLPDAGAGSRTACKCSSLFPDHWSVERVVAAAQNALRRGRTDARGFFRGPGGAGFEVEGWLLPAAASRQACGAARCIATAWPVFEDDATGRALPWHCPLPRR